MCLQSGDLHSIRDCRWKWSCEAHLHVQTEVIMLINVHCHFLNMMNINCSEWAPLVSVVNIRKVQCYINNHQYIFSTRLIFGFIGKQKLHQILRDSPTGTFLLHFSDSEIGAIIITFVSATESKCLCGHSLCLIVFSLTHLLHYFL